jgi:outer membrane murein-binding lipoprotein Lpp
MDRLANRIALVAVIVGGLSLTGCATVESVERAQASADAAGAAAMHAQGSADAAGAAANAAGDAAHRAQQTADAAGSMASDGLKTTNERIDKLERKVRWLSRHHRHGGRGHKAWYCKPNKWHPNRHC